MSKKELKNLDMTGVAEAGQQALQEPEQSITDEKGNIRPEHVDSLSSGAFDQQEYGDASGRTFAESLASSASFGLSDVALVKGADLLGGEKAKEEMQKALRLRREFNPASDVAGTVAGILGPALITGGSSAIAKGVSAGVKGAAKAGTAVENISAKALSNLIKETGEETIARSIIQKSIPKIAGSAVESGFYSTGELISEAALGTEDFNAENLLAYYGTGAMLGGAATGVLGTITAVVPKIKAGKVVSYAKEKVSNLLDKKQAAMKYLDFSVNEQVKLESTVWGNKILDNIPDFLVKKVNLKEANNLKKLFQNSEKALENAGKDIGSIIDDLYTKTLNLESKSMLSLRPTRKELAHSIQDSLDELVKNKNKLGLPDADVKKVLKLVEKQKKAYDEWITGPSASTKLDAPLIREIKTELQSAAYATKKMGDLPIKDQIARAKADASKKVLHDLVKNVDSQLNLQSPGSSNMLQRFEEANLNYGTAVAVRDKLAITAAKDARKSLDPLKQVVYAGAISAVTGSPLLGSAVTIGRKFASSSLKNRLILLTNVEKANQSVTKQINSGISEFFKVSKKVGKSAIPLSTKILTQTQLNTPDNRGNVPRTLKDKKEAYKKLSQNLTKYALDPMPLAEHLAKNSLASYEAAPATSQHMVQTVIKAVQYLHQKMPKSASLSEGINLSKRDYEPSTQELAKFERILTAVNNPTVLLDDLKSGTITRDTVEAVKFVYPNFYQRVQQQVLDKVATDPELPYSKRLQLGVLFEVATDPSLVPQSISVMQQTFKDVEQAQKAAQKEQAAVNMTQGALEKLSFDKDAMTATEKIASRK